MRGGDGETVVSRTFRLLGAFGPGAAELTLDEVAGASGLSRSTAHRLASQLVEVGALERSRRGWRLGTRMFEIGQLVAREERLRGRSVAHMQDLYAATGETVQLAIMDNDAVLYVEIISGHRKVSTPSRRGGRMPLHCTALGKVLLAFSKDGGRAWLEEGVVLDARTAHTITDIDQFRRELNDVRAEQVAFDREEAALGLICVAAPILDSSGVASAALSVSMPAKGRLDFVGVTPAVRTVARALSREAN
jgi:IclR family acetate operon transcriptional repressor